MLCSSGSHWLAFGLVGSLLQVHSGLHGSRHGQVGVLMVHRGSSVFIPSPDEWIFHRFRRIFLVFQVFQVNMSIYNLYVYNISSIFIHVHPFKVWFQLDLNRFRGAPVVTVGAGAGIGHQWWPCLEAAGRCLPARKLGPTEDLRRSPRRCICQERIHHHPLAIMMIMVSIKIAYLTSSGRN